MVYPMSEKKTPRSQNPEAPMIAFSYRSSILPHTEPDLHSSPRCERIEITCKPAVPSCGYIGIRASQKAPKVQHAHADPLIPLGHPRVNT